MVSSNLRSVGYDSQSQILEIEFNQSRIYQYYGVPEHLYEQLIQAPSKGRFFHVYIRHAFPYDRVG
ncbi:MAG: KTSC domain-containing protein [Rhodospirillales bacterium]